ncbi:thiamine pyrophosphate-binding protein [Rubrobacter marinus]|uniref:Thiamine pyrophosphate-binding protein n=1 Tax=Rubrobacter marinus TaxID=2653852 RepID=A0A6G8Q2D6_9ACTN|nr:thiamine pyrophosphate-binding protein [Rubrobacter marinus]
MAVGAADGAPSVATLVARFLRERGVRRFFGLQGGHIQPIWDGAARLGVEIVDVRDERSAVHMAHAHAELTDGFGVAMVTAGPGVTNTVTAVANAHVSRIPLLIIGGCPPRPQVNMGPLQDLPHVEILAPITRRARTLRVGEQVLRELDEALALASGDGGEPGPVYVEIPTDVLRERVSPALVLDEYLRPKPRRKILPDPSMVEEAAEILGSARRPAVIAGRGARRAAHSLVRFLDASGALYLDTQESRGLVPAEHPSIAGAVRGAVMAQADVVLVVGRKLDYQVGYGSPAVFPEARLIRMADAAGELYDNRRGEVEILADTSLTLDALSDELEGRKGNLDAEWTEGLRAKHVERREAAGAALAEAPDGEDGRMHPNRIFHAIRELGLDEGWIGIADGGDLLSFARTGLDARTYLDSGALGCLGVGTPFAVAAALAYPDRTVISVNGDGAFGLNAMEVDTAVRHGAGAVFIVANNGAWNIERYDQATNYGLVVGTELGEANYARMAEAFGAYGERVTDPEDLPNALRRALDNAPALLDVLVSREAVSSDAKKGLGFVADYQALNTWNDAELERRKGTKAPEQVSQKEPTRG